jgi:hypothetical protein
MSAIDSGIECGQCEPLVEAIRRHYAYLFAEYGFRLAHCEDPRQGERCLIGLESARARIKFEIDQGTPVAYFGTLDSPWGWANQIDGVTVWYTDNALLNFVEHRAGEAAPGPTPASSGPERGTDELLTAGAARLRPHAAELIAAFAPDRAAEWWRDLAAYQAERLKQIRQRLKSH